MHWTHCKHVLLFFLIFSEITNQLLSRPLRELSQQHVHAECSVVGCVRSVHGHCELEKFMVFWTPATKPYRNSTHKYVTRKKNVMQL